MKIGTATISGVNTSATTALSSAAHEVLGDKESLKNFADNMAAFAHQLCNHDRTADNSLNISPAELVILRSISQCAPASITHIAQLCRLRVQSVAPHVQQLEKMYLINRLIDTGDRRSMHIVLTSEGLVLLEKDRLQRAHWLAEMMVKNCTPVEMRILLLAGELFAQCFQE